MVFYHKLEFLIPECKKEKLLALLRSIDTSFQNKLDIKVIWNISCGQLTGWSGALQLEDLFM